MSEYWPSTPEEFRWWDRYCAGARLVYTGAMVDAAVALVRGEAKDEARGRLAKTVAAARASELYSDKALAELLHVDRATIRALAKEGSR